MAWGLNNNRLSLQRVKHILAFSHYVTMPFDISNSWFFLLMKNNNIKTKIGAYSCPSGSVKRVSKWFYGFEGIFSTLEGTNRSRFLFLCVFSDKKFRVRYVSKQIKHIFLENQKFYPHFTVFPYFTKLGNAPKRMVGEKKHHIGSQDEKLSLFYRCF